MPPTRTSPDPSHPRPTQLANIPFRFRRKSLSDDDQPHPDYYLVPPSLSPSRSLSMSSSPPSSPTALTTSPARPSYLDTANIHYPSSPTRPTAYHGYGYAYTYPRRPSHHFPYDHDILSADPHPKLSSSPSRPYAIIPSPSTISGRSSFSSLSPTDAGGLRAALSSASEHSAVADGIEDDDIEDYGGFTLDLDDILSGSSPSRRISFTTSSERDRPFVRSPVRAKPIVHRTHFLPQDPLSCPSASVASAELRLIGVQQSDSTRTSASPQLPPPVTPIRSRTRTRSPRATPPPTTASPAVGAGGNDHVLPSSSPISSPLSSPLSSPSRPSDETVRPTTPPCERELRLESDLSLPPSSPIPIPSTPPRNTDRDVEMEIDMLASPPSPTLDALRITSRVAVRALLNPLPQFVPTAASIPLDKEAKIEVIEERISTDGDVTPLDLSSGQATQEDAVVDMVVLDDEVIEEAPIPEPLSQSRASSRAISRAHTPAFVSSQDIPSSPLSPTPSSVMGEQDIDVDVDIDIEDKLPASSVAGPSNYSSRAASPARDVPVRAPPRKKARRDDAMDISRAKPMAKRVRSPLPPSSDSEIETEVSKPRKKGNRQVGPAKTHRKRPRAVLSDDETESDASSSTPVRGPSPISAAAPSAVPKKSKDGGRRKDKPKKPRAKEPASDVELENEPVRASGSASGTGKPRPKPKIKAVVKTSAPKSATNIARADITLPPAIMLSAKTPPPSDLPTAKSKSSSKSATGESKPFREGSARQDSRTRTSDASLPRERAAPTIDPDEALRTYDLPLPVAELEGMLIETLATTRASSLATSALCGALLAARPALREMALPTLRDAAAAAAAAEKVEEEKEKDAGGRRRGAKAKADTASRRAWAGAIEGVLEAGARRCGVFGKVVNCGTDMGNHALALEARWFYDADRDEDRDRAALVSSMMRRPGKRSETKKAKQYYWRPLPKISRWDAEDEL